MEHEQRSLHGYYKGDSYEEFADEVLDMYPELSYDLHYVPPDALNATHTTCNPIDTKREPHYLEEEIMPLSSAIFVPMLPLPCLGDTASSPVQDDHICPSRFSAPIQAPLAALVVQNATTVEQSTSLDDPRITDETALYDDSSISALLECSSDAPNTHSYVPDDPEIYLDGARAASEEMHSHALTVCINVPWLTSLTLRVNFPAQHAYARDANLGITIQYRVFSAAFITKRISSTLQQTTGSQMLMLHANLPVQSPHSSPGAIQCLSHVPQPAIIAHRALSILRKFAFSIIDHLMQASHFASMNTEVTAYAEGRRKMKKSPRTRPSSVHLYLTSAHTS
ncbi:hypothetical protein BD769DRAFT_1674652 [Suillus cothurnatus]|nr:hypothetical protein BD769DRAFT_1674652 [Suillus cothurnatus]